MNKTQSHVEGTLELDGGTILEFIAKSFDKDNDDYVFHDLYFKLEYDPLGPFTVKASDIHGKWKWELIFRV